MKIMTNVEIVWSIHVFFFKAAIIPKGIDITPISEEFIQKIEEWINNYPRAMFEYKSSNMILYRYVES